MLYGEQGEGCEMGSTKAQEWGVLLFLVAVLAMLVVLSVALGAPTVA